MDPQELTGLPLHAVQHPFVYDGDFKVRVHGFRGLHQQQSMHARMDCKELHRHVTSGTSPTGQEESDGPFYASQLVHYGLPIDRLQPRAIKTLKDIFKTRNGAPTLHVPDTIRIIERKLKKEFEALVSRHSLSRQLQENQEEAKVLQTKLAHLRTTFQTQEQEILAKLKSLEALSIKYTTQLTAVDESRKALNEEVKDESDTEAQDSRVDVSLAECSISNKRKHQERNQTPTGNQSPAKGYPKRTRIGTPYAPPARREIDISPASEVPGRHKRWQIAPHANTNQYTTPINRSQTARQQAATTYRRDSNVST